MLHLIHLVYVSKGSFRRPAKPCVAAVRCGEIRNNPNFAAPQCGAFLKIEVLTLASFAAPQCGAADYHRTCK